VELVLLTLNNLFLVDGCAQATRNVYMHSDSEAAEIKTSVVVPVNGHYVMKTDGEWR
jgi:hypothetical protein